LSGKSGAILSLEKVNTALASLSQLMSSKKNSSILEEVAGRKHYMFIKEKLIHMLKFYKRKKATKIGDEPDAE